MVDHIQTIRRQLALEQHVFTDNFLVYSFRKYMAYLEFNMIQSLFSVGAQILLQICDKK